jgi:outer membrane immunogenic protein
MKTGLLASALLLVAAPAMAADLKLPPAPPLPPAVEEGPMWTGFYAGLNAGGAWSNANTLQLASAPVWLSPDNPGPNPSGPLDYSTAAALAASGNWPAGSSGGFIGGGQIGYAYQIASFVMGIEADIQGLAGSGGAGSPGWRAVSVPGPNVMGHSIAAAFSARKSLDWMGTVRGRIGYLLSPTLMVYGVGGLAYGGVSAGVSGFAAQTPDNPIYSITGPGSAAYASTAVGWTAGGGLEWMFLPGWSVKAEYLYVDLGSARFPVGVTGQSLNAGGPNDGLKWATATSATARFNGNIARAGVNYHFHFGGTPFAGL